MYPILTEVLPQLGKSSKWFHLTDSVLYETNLAREVMINDHGVFFVCFCFGFLFFWVFFSICLPLLFVLGLKACATITQLVLFF